MNQRNETSLSNSRLRHAFDMLVDGELRENERVDLLKKCETEPELWRLCAIAFLEARDFNAGLSGDEPSAKSERAPGGNSTWNPNRWQGYVALAASLMISFGLGGMAVKQSDNRASGHPVQQAGVNVSRAHSTPFAQAGMLGNPKAATVLVRGERGLHPMRIPIVSTPGQGQRQADTPDPWSPELLEQLQAMGFGVTRTKRSLPARLSDGRLLLIPVEEIEIKDELESDETLLFQ